MSPRIAPGRLRDIGLPAYVMSRAAGRVTGTRPPAIFTTLARTRGLYWGWLHFAGALMPFGRLPRRESELVILRVAHRRGNAYEWAHHTLLGRRSGVTGDEIVRLGQDNAEAVWTPRETVLLAATDELLRDRDLCDDTWRSVRTHLDEREAIELLLLVGHYDMLATTLGTLRLAPDPAR
ncbi:carboxymuconolactone decarboxylase family protein [Leekyejoonella antrihumi]|uniref:Carboxymuconolactone decarboxylase family protein n=1 Tax=Leekyejoonella antrihumi TaxID=1660198 RepID=A0A563E5P1_9MICO|nr:carboxymuconolactone decarboxylase family protein [Leekyejoonella antrihumi]TWP37609.1 carboxymuconolactone decarboxylase family protein [Leekyejoonella antrihumi]